MSNNPVETKAAVTGVEAAKVDAAISGIAGTTQAESQDVTRSHEEESNSEVPGDPRTVNERQPPTKEEY